MVPAFRIAKAIPQAASLAREMFTISVSVPSGFLTRPHAGIDLVRLDAEHRLGAADAMQIIALSGRGRALYDLAGAGARRGGAGDVTA